jgi:hypothetical protein
MTNFMSDSISCSEIKSIENNNDGEEERSRCST